jgi:hypothetical protein
MVSTGNTKVALGFLCAGCGTVHLRRKKIETHIAFFFNVKGGFCFDKEKYRVKSIACTDYKSSLPIAAKNEQIFEFNS